MSAGVAAVDIGTNSVRVLVTDPTGRELLREMRITRLGQGVDEDGRLQPEAIARTIAVLSEYAGAIARLGVTRLRATATSAARDAKNGAEFLDAAAQVLGATPELLSGQQEAALMFRGATAGLPKARAPFLVIDIGGGSTEFALGVDAPQALLSVDLGCVRMTERHLHSDPPTKAELAACTQEVRQVLARVPETIEVKRAGCVIGTAGTVTTVASLVLGLQEYDASRTHHLELSLEQVESQLARLQSANIAARRQMLAEPGRAEVIVGGVIVLATLMRELGLPKLQVSERDILDGIATSLLEA